jgi:hypothetical protein
VNKPRNEHTNADTKARHESTHQRKTNLQPTNQPHTQFHATVQLGATLEAFWTASKKVLYPLQSSDRGPRCSPPRSLPASLSSRRSWTASLPRVRLYAIDRVALRSIQPLSTNSLLLSSSDLVVTLSRSPRLFLCATTGRFLQPWRPLLRRASRPGSGGTTR